MILKQPSTRCQGGTAFGLQIPCLGYVLHMKEYDFYLLMFKFASSQRLINFLLVTFGSCSYLSSATIMAQVACLLQKGIFIQGVKVARFINFFEMDLDFYVFALH